jgi:hypothetical protein
MTYPDGITLDYLRELPARAHASWCINRRADGGLELPIRVVQGRLGHAGIQQRRSVTAICSRAATTAPELAAAERAFMAVP